MYNTSEPDWQPINQLPLTLPAKVRDWLTAEVSLTSRLRQHGVFQVQLLQEGWGLGLPSETTLLGVDINAKVWFRDVVLKVDDTPWVIGHTLIPAQTLTAIPKLQMLGTRSLGDLIFNELNGKREILEFAYLQQKHPLFQLSESFWRTKIKNLWARRSLICVQNQHLLINEAFIFGD